MTEAPPEPSAAEPPAEPAAVEPAPAEDDGNQIPLWAFALVFLSAPVIMTAIPFFLQLHRAGKISPLGIGLMIGHVAGAAGLLGAWFYLRRHG